MTEAVVEFFKFVGELNAKKIAGLVFFLGLGGLCVWIFERQSASVRLSRLERAQKLIGEVAGLERSGALSPEIQEAERGIKRQLISLIAQTDTVEVSYNVSLPVVSSKRAILVFLAGMGPWLFLSGIMAGAIRRKDASGGAAIVGLTIMGALCGVGNLVLPTVNPWITFLVAPLAFFLGTGGVAILLSIGAAVRKSAQRTAIRNNLRQLSAAIDHYFLENGKTEARYEDIVGEDKYLVRLVSVAGEDYGRLPLKQGETLWRVRTRDGEVVELSR